VPRARLDLRGFRWSIVKVLLTYGVFTSLITAANVIRANIASAVIGRVISLEAISVYAIAVLMVSYLGRSILSGAGVLTPRFAGLEGLGDSEVLKGLFLKAMWIGSALSCAGAMVMVICGRQAIRLWVGDEFLGAGSVLYVLAFTCAMTVSQAPAHSLLYAMNKHRFLAMVLLPEAFVNLGLSIVLARHYGIIGVAFGTAIPAAVTNLLLQPVYVCRTLKVGLYRYYCRILVPLAIAVVIAVLVTPVVAGLQLGWSWR